jgi:hypothetical protein
MQDTRHQSQRGGVKVSPWPCSWGPAVKQVLFWVNRLYTGGRI